jgi:hypothetical protein
MLISKELFEVEEAGSTRSPVCDVVVDDSWGTVIVLLLLSTNVSVKECNDGGGGGAIAGGGAEGGCISATPTAALSSNIPGAVII